jgi:hypothetical protein
MAKRAGNCDHFCPDRRGLDDALAQLQYNVRPGEVLLRNRPFYRTNLTLQCQVLLPIHPYGLVFG